MLVLDEADEMLNKGEGMTAGSLDGRRHLQLGTAHYSVVLFRVQRADLRCVPLLASSHAGGFDQRHTASRDPGDDQQVHDGPHPHPGQTVSPPTPRKTQRSHLEKIEEVCR